MGATRCMTLEKQTERVYVYAILQPTLTERFPTEVRATASGFCCHLLDYWLAYNCLRSISLKTVPASQSASTSISVGVPQRRSEIPTAIPDAATGDRLPTLSSRCSITMGEQLRRRGCPEPSACQSSNLTRSRPRALDQWSAGRSSSYPLTAPNQFDILRTASGATEVETSP
jgi:hypothetical protein